MNERNEGRGSKTAEKVPTPLFRWGMRFNPHMIVFLIMLLAAMPPLRGAIVSFVHVWWDKSFTKVDFIMDEARPNEGYPYIVGHLDGSTDQRRVVGLIQGTAMVVRGAPMETFEPGKRMPIWHSPEVPNFVAFGAEMNDLPVAAVPERPGLLSFLGYFAWLLVTLVVGFGAMGWVRNRWGRRAYGDLPMHRRAGRTFMV